MACVARSPITSCKQRPAFLLRLRRFPETRRFLHLLQALHSKVKILELWRAHETFSRFCFCSTRGTFTLRPRRPAARLGKHSLCHGVLLQSPVGPPKRIPGPLPEKPLPALA